MYVYLKSEPGLWTVGYYGPNGEWRSESDHNSPGEAASRVAYLNGSVKYNQQEVTELFEELHNTLNRLLNWMST